MTVENSDYEAVLSKSVMLQPLIISHSAKDQLKSHKKFCARKFNELK